MMQDGVSGKAIALWNASDSHIHDLNDKEDMGYKSKKRQTGKTKKRARRIVCISSFEDDKDEPFYYLHVRDHSVGKRIPLIIDTVNRFTKLGLVGSFPGIANCIIYSGVRFKYFPYHVEDEDLASESFKFYGGEQIMVWNSCLLSKSV